MPQPLSEEVLRQTFTEAGQGHVFTYFDSLTTEGKAKLLKQLDTIDVNRVNRIFAKATTAPPHDKDAIDPLPFESFSSTLDPNDQPHVTDWRATGLRAIAQGKVAVILLAGGQGTRLGSSSPKGCYDIGLPSHKSLFQIQAERILQIQKIAQRNYPEIASTAIVPFYIMTSEPTRVETENFFKNNNYFGLNVQHVMFFNQGVLPAFTMDGKILMEDKGVVATAPDGNGGIYKALRREGVLADLERRGIPYIHAYCVDNCLVKVADPVFIGYCVSKNAKCGVKVVPKQRASEPVGVVCLRDHKFAVVEYSEIPAELSNQLKDDGKTLMYNAANIANHFYTTEFLNSIEEMEKTMEFHVAKKKIKHIDLATGTLIVPTANNGIKLELFIFDVFPFVEKLAVLETPRKEEFSPLKNGPGSKDGDSPDTSRADVLAQHKRFIEAAGGTVVGDVELSPLVTYGGEGLDKLNGVALQGPKNIESL
ncbi:nucleotide-diphospho-sugar transferase [Rhizoclosmatium globosum]|uniref:UDP-N-acetylglucosamine diphosphorylase n=1 Tax=Rhizoclosmatium globosum TaxID=329046 RepID=A0A1Y2B1V4_9FUNG|nr:nucleotide-diphospho-sugar transferase [Rhizoclosmatium globosum]|eukprot:ORY28716.1 nucleotide-diphospho-sugar transferase [Rhizoclosmatium globosum]